MQTSVKNRNMLAGMLMLTISFLSVDLWAQQGSTYLTGKVMEANKESGEEPLAGAHVLWQGTTVGVATNEEGSFRLPLVDGATHLVISFVGYQADTIRWDGSLGINIFLQSDATLDEVEVVHRQKPMNIGFYDAAYVAQVSDKELLKAACCNLSESFETLPSVDVSYSDAVTGVRQIEMLGLAGPYTQITRENMPGVRGLSANYGLTYVPGTWVDGMQLIKGVGSVLNGYESIAGQINVELRKPQSADRMYLNLYAGEGGRFELNANLAHRMKDERWSSALLLHAAALTMEMDRNNDGFLDNPLGNQLIALNRWNFDSGDGLHIDFGVKGVFVDNTAGQFEGGPHTGGPALPSEDPDHIHGPNRPDGLWQLTLNTRRLEAWGKVGKVYESMPWKSIAMQVSGTLHNQESTFGLREYEAGQRSFYSNFIYQSMISNTNHKFRTGFSLQYDDFTEQLDQRNFDRTELVPGAYFEYTYSLLDKFNAVAGLRADYHNLFGFFMTPRLQLRYALTDNTVLRASGGRGQRTANLLAENTGLLASARQMVFNSTRTNTPYGLDAEVAWNFGVSLTQEFMLDYRPGSFSVDIYRTDFQNQIVVDLDQNPQQALFYNLDGRSFSNSFQAQVDYELTKRFDVRLAYRFLDVQTTFSGELLERPLVSAHRAFANLAYESRNGWKFDYTVNWQGSKRLPFTGSNPEIYQLPNRSPNFVVMNAQVSKSWKEGRFEVYVGAENLLDFRLENPIIAAEDPFGPYFDSSLVWGPIFGRMSYVGLRYRLP